MSAKKNKSYWGLAALLSFLGVAVGFLTYNGPALLVSVPVFLVSATVSAYRHLRWWESYVKNPPF